MLMRGMGSSGKSLRDMPDPEGAAMIDEIDWGEGFEAGMKKGREEGLQEGYLKGYRAAMIDAAVIHQSAKHDAPLRDGAGPDD
jgi:hypothetical protein